MRDTASLTEALLVVKGAAAPFAIAAPRPRSRPIDARPRVSVRLDEAQHRRLRLAAAHRSVSVHALLAEAVGHYLDRTIADSVDPSCACLARRSADNVATLLLRTS